MEQLFFLLLNVFTFITLTLTITWMFGLTDIRIDRMKFKITRQKETLLRETIKYYIEKVFYHGFAVGALIMLIFIAWYNTYLFLFLMLFVLIVLFLLWLTEVINVSDFIGGSENEY